MKSLVPVFLVALIVVAAVSFEVGTLYGRGTSPTGTTSRTTGTTSATDSTSTYRGTQVRMGRVEAPSLSKAPTAGAVYTNVSYCDDGSDGGPQLLDMWYPTSGFTDSNPVVVWIHGGGWSKGNGIDGGGFPQDIFPGSDLLANGFIIVSINYRLAPNYPFPAQQYDAQCAIAFLKEHAGELKVKGDEIDVAGGSAGGQIASWVGVNQTALYRVAAVGVVSGPENVSATYSFDGAWTQAVADAWSNNSALKYAGSPVNFVSASDPPYLLMHGYNDTVVPYDQAVQMYNALSAVGAPVQLVLVNCAGHGLSILPDATCSPDPPSSATLNDLLAFFEAHP